MARVTSKLQVTVPKTIADQFSIEPGDEIDWIPAGDGIRVVKRGGRRPGTDADSGKLRLRLFDQASERQRMRDREVKAAAAASGQPAGRGWTREDLYRRGRPG